MLDSFLKKYQVLTRPLFLNEQFLNCTSLLISNFIKSQILGLNRILNFKYRFRLSDQDPAQADPMMKVQNELDETKIILHNTIEAVLQRGEKLDDLVNLCNTFDVVIELIR